jgi:SPX domain protein involved in polyphosphate accumulation
MDGRTEKDAYGDYTICSVYFDTENYSLIRSSIEKPVFKEKLRLRSYGIPKADDLVFLEIKRKFTAWYTNAALR